MALKTTSIPPQRGGPLTPPGGGMLPRRGPITPPGGGMPPRPGRGGPITPPGGGMPPQPGGGGLNGKELARRLEEARKNGTLHKLVGRADAAKFGSGPFSTDIGELKKLFGSSDLRGIMGGGGKPKGPITPPGPLNLPPKAQQPKTLPPKAAPPGVAGPPPAINVPAPPAAPPATGGGGSPGGGGVPPPAAAASTDGPLAGLAAMGEMPQVSLPSPADVPLGLRAGLGTRQYPSMQSPLAGLRRIY